MANGWSDEETFKFIELYKSCPEIWDPKHIYHKDRRKVRNAWARIADEMLVSVDDLKRKKETLLAAFRSNHKKFLVSHKAGGEFEPYKPIWRYYDALADFMSDVYECKALVTTTEIDDVAEDSVEVLEDLSEEDESLEAPPSPQPQELKISQQFIPVRRQHNDSAERELKEINRHMKSAVSTLNNTVAGIKNRVDKDDCDLYGKLLAKVLREFNEIDRLELRHEIDGLIIKKKRLLLSRHDKREDPLA